MQKLMVIMTVLGLVACGGEGRPIGSSSSSAASSESSSNNGFIGNAQTIQIGDVTLGQVGPTDIYDYYEFSAQQGQVLSINLVGNTSDDIDLYLYSNDQLIEASTLNGGIETITYTVLVSGALQVAVKYYAGDASDYRLTITAN